MAKAILFSVVISLLAIPLVAARSASPKRGLKRVIVWVIVFNVLYLLTVRYVYPRLL